MKRLGLILLIAAFVFWMVNPPLFNSMAQKISQQIKAELQKKSRQLLAHLTQTAQQSLQQKSQAILGEAIGLKPTPKPEAIIVKNVPDSQLRALVLIDYLTQKDLSLSFRAGEVYYLDLRNVPENNCLYINEESYAPRNNQFIKLSFQESGRYDLFFDLCRQNKAKFGEIIVE